MYVYIISFVLEMAVFSDIHTFFAGTSAPVGKVLPLTLDHDWPAYVDPRNHVESLQELQLGDRTIWLSHTISYYLTISVFRSVLPGAELRWGHVSDIGGPGFKPVNTPAARHDLKMCQGDRIKIGGNCHFYCHQSIDISQRHQIHNIQFLPGLTSWDGWSYCTPCIIFFSMAHLHLI